MISLKQLKYAVAGNLASVVLAIIGPAQIGSADSPPSRPNVLLIAVDDLRPELGCYGAPDAKTPNLDRFASTCRIFDRHYVQVATCGASRFSMLTGQYPSRAAQLNNSAFDALQSKKGRKLTLPELLKQHGYYTESIGKISHSPDGRRFAKEAKGESGDGGPEMPDAWHEVGTPVGPWNDGWSAFFAYADGQSRKRGETPPLQSASVQDDGYPDGLIAEKAVETLERLSADEQPFFLAVGFYKPHLPFCAPKRYWDWFDRSQISLAEFRSAPYGVDESISLHQSGEVFGNYGQHPEDGRNNEDYARKLRHGYLAATSYVDAQIGKVLTRLEHLDPERNTIVIIWGDHGWHLGDHGLWGKHTLHDVALRSTLIVRVPNLNQPGRHSDAIVESVSLFATVARLCKLEIPVGVHSVTLLPQIEDADSKSAGKAFAFWPKSNAIGYSIRTAQHRATEWIDRKSGERRQVELYDHSVDPLESRNAAEGNEEILEALLQQIEPKRL